MLGDLIVRNAKLRRDAPAIIFEGRTITHGEFAARSFRLARALQRLGLGVGDRVAILAQNCPEYLEVYAAGELAGWATVTINYRLAEPEVAYILADSKPKAIICEATLLDRLSETTRRAFEHVITFGGDGPDIDYEDSARGGRAGRPEHRARARDDRLLDLHQRDYGTAQRSDADPWRSALVGLCLRDRYGGPPHRSRCGGHAALPHRRQEHLPHAIRARLHRRPASRLPRRAVFREPAGAPGDGDVAGADHAERPP